MLLEEPRIVRNGAGEVTLAAGDTQAEIRYTLDGTEPGPSSVLYAKPFPMTGRGVVKALVRDPEDRRTSAVASRGFDIPCGAFRVKELPDEEAVGLFDGDVSTVVYLPAGVAGFSADTGEERTFRGFAYTPDQSRWASGVVTRYRVSSTAVRRRRANSRISSTIRWSRSWNSSRCAGVPSGSRRCRSLRATVPASRNFRF